MYLRSSICLCVAAMAGPMLGAAASGVVDVSALDAVPERTAYQVPKYPPSLVQNGASADVSMTLIIDIDGSVRDVEDVKAPAPEFAAVARAAVERWRFQSGYIKGLPTLYRVPVTVALRVDGSDGKLDTKPAGGTFMTVEDASVEYEVPPAYPADLVKEPRDGIAVVDLLVDASGAPSDAVVEYASHPAFVVPAGEAVLTWKFSPARREGRLVAVRTRVMVRFRKDDARLTAADRTTLAQLGQARDFDVAPEPVTQYPLIYPYDALIKGERGAATLQVVVSPDGQVIKANPAPGTGGEFAAAARACISRWTFHPATKVEMPVFAAISWQISFRDDASELQYDEVALELLATLRAGSAKFVSAGGLDAPLKALDQPKPQLPPGTDPASSVGEVMIEAIIDRNGRCQFPRIVSAPNMEMGYAAATEIARCRFTPPRKGGQPVDVRVKVPFHFAPAKPGNSAGGG
jgi:TonB family protein